MRVVGEELRVSPIAPIIIWMASRSRPQQRYDHRLRELVQRTGDLTIATDLGGPRSTARGWLRAAPGVVVTADLADLTAPELRQEILKLRRRVEKLAALLRLALAVVHASGFNLSCERLPDGPAKERILRAVDRARGCLPLRGVLRFLGLSSGRCQACRCQAWRQRHIACTLDDQSSCPRISPHRLTRAEIQTIGDMVTSADYRHGADRHPRHARAPTRQGICVVVDVVSPRTRVRLAASAAPSASDQAEGGTSHHWS